MTTEATYTNALTTGRGNTVADTGGLDRRLIVKVRLNDDGSANLELDTIVNHNLVTVTLYKPPSGKAVIEFSQTVHAPTGTTIFDYVHATVPLRAEDSKGIIEFSQLGVLLLLAYTSGRLDELKFENPDSQKALEVVRRRLNGVIKEIKGHWRKLGLTV